MNAMTEALHAVDVITRVRDRLEAEGADAELFRLRRFSSDELAILVRLELGLDFVMYGIPARYKNVPLPIMENRQNNTEVVGKKKPAARAAKPRRRSFSPPAPQGRRGTVAA